MDEIYYHSLNNLQHKYNYGHNFSKFLKLLKLKLLNLQGDKFYYNSLGFFKFILV